MAYALNINLSERNWRHSVSATVSAVQSANFLPNNQWQLWTGLNYITKQTAAGTAAQTAVSSSAYSLANNAPTFTVANTQALRVGDLVVVSSGGFQWGYAGSGYVSTATANRVAAIVSNTSVTVASSPLGGVTPAGSAATTLTPITPGDNGSGTGQAADGWKKSTTLTVWADDWAANACPGAIRTMGIRKGSASAESISWTVSPNQIAKYQGQDVVFGVLVRQKVQGGQGTWRTYISDDVTGTTYSDYAQGTRYTEPTYGGFQFLSVSALVSASATTFSMGISFTGASSDVYYVALPTGCIGSAISVANCRQATSEIIRPVTHWNPPLLTPLTMTFPLAAYPGTGGLLYGFSGQDLEAMSMGMIHKSVAMVKCKIEFSTLTIGDDLFTGTRLDYSLIFGPQVVIQRASTINVGQGWLPLADDGSFAIFTASASTVIANATFDFDLVQLSMPNSVN